MLLISAVSGKSANVNVLLTGLTTLSWSLRVTLTISADPIDPRTGIVALVDRDPSMGSRILMSCVTDPVDPVLERVDPVVVVLAIRLLRRFLPSLRTKRGLSTILSSIPPTSVESWSPGFARSDADIMIRLPAFRVYSPIEVDICVSHVIAYTVL